jgi:hypothetical protein
MQRHPVSDVSVLPVFCMFGASYCIVLYKKYGEVASIMYNSGSVRLVSSSDGASFLVLETQMHI